MGSKHYCDRCDKEVYGKDDLEKMILLGKPRTEELCRECDKSWEAYKEELIPKVIEDFFDRQRIVKELDERKRKQEEADKNWKPSKTRC